VWVFFDFILPFLLVFALVFGILSRVKVFEDNRGINGIIALSVGLMSLQFGYVSEFFSVIFPRIGIGLAVILLLLIMIGLFSDDDNAASKWILWGSGVVIALVILVDTFEESVLWNSTFFFDTTISELLIYAFIVALLSVVTFSGGNKNNPISRVAKKFSSAFE